MRNLKKALALVLALMMTLSLMVTASASDYTDDSAIEQDEAVAVMSALGVFNGTDGGKFDPAGNLTRAQAAKIITYMLLGQEVADSLPNTGSKFADCRDGQWYVGSVNYLTDLGIVAGRNETTFDPKGNVTGYEFAKMLLGALGYDSKTERFEGDSAWSINIATTARRAGLDEGLAVSVLTSLPLTREQAAKLAFNTLTATMVYYQGGVIVGDVTVNPTRDKVSNSKSNDYNVKVADQDEYMQFCEQYFPGLKFNTDFVGTDDFGRDLAKQWKNGNDVAYTGAAEATVVLTEEVDEAGLVKLLPKNAAPDTSVTVVANGYSNSDATGSKTLAQIAAMTADGKQVEIFVNSSNKINKVVTTKYRVETVTSITEKNGATTYKFSGTTGNKVNNDDKTEVVLAGDVAKGDVVTTTIGVSGKVYVYPTSTFTGNQTAKKGTTVTIGGAQYNIASSAVTGASAASAYVNSKDEANYWADMNGYLVKVEGIETEQDINYAVITKAIYGSSANPTLDNPNPGQTVNVRAVLDDGSVLDVTLKTKKAAGTEDDAEGWTGDTIAEDDTICGNVKIGGAGLSSSDMTALEGKLVGYYMDDGKMVLDKVDFAVSVAKDDVSGLNMADGYAGATSASGKDTQTSVKAVFNSKTVFIIYKVDENNKITANVVTGVANLKIAATNGGKAVITGTGTNLGTASVVFLKDAAAVVSDVDYVYINKSSAENVLRDGEKNVWKYTGITPDGEEIDVYTENNTALATANGLYAYDPETMVIGASKVLVSAATGEANSQFNHVIKAQTSEELIYVNDTWLPTTDDTKVVYVNELDGIAGNNCLIEVKDGKIVTIYVYACQHAGTNAWSKAQAGDVTDDCGYVVGDHIQKCGQCGAVLKNHAKPVCAGGADHSDGEGQAVSCGVEGCTVTEPNCTVNHTATP